MEATVISRRQTGAAGIRIIELGGGRRLNPSGSIQRLLGLFKDAGKCQSLKKLFSSVFFGMRATKTIAMYKRLWFGRYVIGRGMSRFLICC